MRRIVLLLSIQLIAFAALAQVSSEYGRASSGPIETIIKTPRHTSASLSLLSGRGYGGTVGGQLVPDRLWFFGSASHTTTNAKVSAQPVDWASVTGSFSRFNQPSLVTTPALANSFLSLRSTAVLSNQMTMDFSVTRSNAAHSLIP